MATTVFLLDGFGWTGFLKFIAIAKKLGSAPNRMVQVPYNNQVGHSLPNVVAGAAMLDGLLHNPLYEDDDKVVLGISMGSQVALYWQRVYGPASTVPASGAGKLRFLHLACPENRFTGVSVIAPDTWGGGYDGIGLPTGGTKYDTEFFHRQHDGVADYPNKPNPNGTAVANAVAGMALVHNNYFNVTLDDTQNVTFVDSSHPGTGVVKYTVAPTFPMPLLSAAGLFGKEYAMRRDQEVRPQVEMAYDRPKHVPMPDYWGVKGEDARQRRTRVCSPSRPAFWAKIK